jgi:acyl transferase domain-containing protein
MAQPLLFGLETAFARALAAKGVRPDCVLGHSLGEYAAAVQAGIFSLEDGARLGVGRAALMQAAPPGRMLMVTLHRDVLGDVLGALFDQVSFPSTTACQLRLSASPRPGRLPEGRGAPWSAGCISKPRTPFTPSP